MKPLAIIAAVIFAFWLLLMWPRFRGAREAAPRSQCRNNLKAIGLALHQYHDEHGSFPPAYFADADGVPIHSWRVMILPYLGEKEKELFDEYKFNEPWNGPSNIKLLDRVPYVYRCPSFVRDSRGWFSTDETVKSKTNHVIVDDPHGVFHRDAAATKADIEDGQYETVAVVETHNHVVDWLQPDDMTTDELLAEFGAAENETETHQHVGGTHFLLTDGSVRFISSLAPAETIRGSITKNGRETLDDF